MHNDYEGKVPPTTPPVSPPITQERKDDASIYGDEYKATDLNIEGKGHWKVHPIGRLRVLANSRNWPIANSPVPTNDNHFVFQSKQDRQTSEPAGRRRRSPRPPSTRSKRSSPVEDELGDRAAGITL